MDGRDDLDGVLVAARLNNRVRVGVGRGAQPIFLHFSFSDK